MHPWNQVGQYLSYLVSYIDSMTGWLICKLSLTRRRKNMEFADSMNTQVYMNDWLPFQLSCQEEQKSREPIIEERVSLIDRLIKLREGMLFDQVVELIGHPDKVRCLGEGRWFLFYSLPGKSDLRIVLKPGLIWAKLFVSETEVKIVA
jgi:hypothetical protein